MDFVFKDFGFLIVLIGFRHEPPPLHQRSDHIPRRGRRSKGASVDMPLETRKRLEAGQNAREFVQTRNSTLPLMSASGPTPRCRLLDHELYYTDGTDELSLSVLSVKSVVKV